MTSMSSRLERLAGNPSTSANSRVTSRSASSSQRPLPRNTPETLTRWWQVMIMKALFMIRYVATKEVTIQALGADHKNETLDAEQGRQHFNRVFQYIKDKEASQPKLEFTRMIGNYRCRSRRRDSQSTPRRRACTRTAPWCAEATPRRGTE